MLPRWFLTLPDMDTIIQEFTNKAIEDANIDLGGVPSVSLEQFDPPKFVATVPLQPEVDLGNFSSIRVPLPAQGGRPGSDSRADQQAGPQLLE